MSYLNPSYPHEFPDPFILKVGHEYWAYCTGKWHDGHYFGILHSRDLVTWEVKAGALAPMPGNYHHYWAPEVVILNGQYYLYYSVGDDATMHIRVAVATRPDGPFEDCGNRLTRERFTIDAHVFVDCNGYRHLFYATDFLDHSHIGTGTMRDGMGNPYSLNEMPVPVTRAQYDWQVYDPQRADKGRVRWYTVEGPFVLYHKGLYYQMFSGGNYQNPSYGGSYATSPSLYQGEQWTQVADGETTLPLLRSLPDVGVIGPGHNSVVVGPDNRQLYCVYHRWAADGSGRQMAMDRLEFVGGRMVYLAPAPRRNRYPLAPPSRRGPLPGNGRRACG